MIFATILHLPLNSPLWLRAAANSTLALHIGGGLVGIASGAAALLFAKGGPGHRVAGKVFLVSMLIMAAIGAAVSPLIKQPGNMLGGLFVIYLVLTGWASIRRKAGAPATLEIGAMLIALGVVAAGARLGWLGARDPRGEIAGIPYQAPLIFAAIAALAVAMDLRVIMHGGLSGERRLARHLWRMCLALFIATASLFIGQPKVFPEALRGSPVLAALAVAPLVAMFFWLLRVRLAGRFRGEAAHAHGVTT